MRHPLAAGQVSFRDGLAWTGAWALVAFLGAYTLNPVCALIFLLGCGLEAVYCLLLKVSHLRLLVAGVVKSLGAAGRGLCRGPQARAGLPGGSLSLALSLGSGRPKHPGRLARRRTGPPP